MKFSNINLAAQAAAVPQSAAAQAPQLPPEAMPVPPFPEVPPFAEGYGAGQAQVPQTQAPAPVQASPDSRQMPPAPAKEEYYDDSWMPFEMRKTRRLMGMTGKRMAPHLALGDKAPKQPAPQQAPAQRLSSKEPEVRSASQAPVPAVPDPQLIPAVKAAQVPVATPAAPVARLSLATMAAEMQSCYKLCEMLSRSPFTPKALQGRPEFVFLAIKYGEGLGLDPFQALQGITVINGKPCLFGDSLLALCLPHGDIQESFDEQKQMAVCTCRRQGKSPVVRTFSMEEAFQAGLVSFDKNGHALGRSKEGWTPNAPWGAYPKRMLQMRARGFALRDAFPDVLRGVISAEEASDYRV